LVFSTPVPQREREREREHRFIKVNILESIERWVAVVRCRLSATREMSFPRCHCVFITTDMIGVHTHARDRPRDQGMLLTDPVDEQVQSSPVRSERCLVAMHPCHHSSSTLPSFALSPIRPPRPSSTSPRLARRPTAAPPSSAAHRPSVRPSSSPPDLHYGTT